MSEEAKVISIFGQKTKTEKEEEKIEAKAEYDFEQIAKAKHDNEERIKNDRLKSNKGVIRSYRLKR